MRYRYRVAIWKPSAAIGVAGFVAGIMLVGIGGALAPAPLASVDVTHSQPPAPWPKVTRAMLMSVDVPSHDPTPIGPRAVLIPVEPPPPPGPEAIVISDPPGPDPGPKAIVITDTTGDGSGPKAVVISGSDPPGDGPKAVVISGSAPRPVS